MRNYYSHINKIMFVVLTVFMTSSAVQALNLKLPFNCLTSCTKKACANDLDLADKCKGNCKASQIANCLAATKGKEGAPILESDPKILEAIKDASLAAHAPGATIQEKNNYRKVCDTNCTEKACGNYPWQYAYCRKFCTPPSQKVQGCLKTGAAEFPGKRGELNIIVEDDESSQTSKKRQKSSSGKDGNPSANRVRRTK